MSFVYINIYIYGQETEYMTFWTERQWAIGEQIYVTRKVLTCVQEISLEHVTNNTYENINIRIGEPGRCSRHSNEPRTGRSGVRTLAKANFHFWSSPDRLWGPQLNGYRGYFQGVKQPGSEVYSDLPNADVKNERSNTSTSCKCLHGVNRDSFAFLYEQRWPYSIVLGKNCCSS
jgi:hypothetical protein